MDDVTTILPLTGWKRLNVNVTLRQSRDSLYAAEYNLY